MVQQHIWKGMLMSCFSPVCQPLVELWEFAPEPPDAVTDLSSCVTEISLLCVLFTGVFRLILDLCQAAFPDNMHADMVGFNNWRWETQTKIRNDSMFFYHRDAAAFIMKAFSRDAQCSRHSTAREVRRNPIGAITRTHFYPHQPRRSITRPVSRRALFVSSISDLSAALGLSWHPPVWSQGIRSPRRRGVCSLHVEGSGGARLLRAALTLWGYM